MSKIKLVYNTAFYKCMQFSSANSRLGGTNDPEHLSPSCTNNDTVHVKKNVDM